MNYDIQKEQSHANPNPYMKELLIHRFNTIKQEIECLKPTIAIFFDYDTSWAKYLRII